MAGSIAVLGAGSWGTALALLVARNGCAVRLWGHRPEHIEQINAARRNLKYLPNAEFPENLRATADLRGAVEGAAAILISVPSRAFRDVLEQLAALQVPRVGRVAWATKGLEKPSGRLLHEVVEEVLGPDTETAVLSGPTFAGELASGLPTAITIASASEAFAKDMAGYLHNQSFRAYTTNDLVGVQLGGATKNVLAIAAGVADGLGFGANARAALITRGLAEMMRLALALGARNETLMGLAGVGDLILTCTDNQSRNRRFGLGLGKGLSREEIVRDIGQEIEGAGAAALVYCLAQRHGVEMPITEQVYRILNEDLAPLDAVKNLLQREPKSES